MSLAERRRTSAECCARRAKQRGLTLADISRSTKIKELQLERLEAADHDTLPAEVFVIGFIKAYAREVGVDCAEALDCYRAARPAAPPVVYEKPLVEPVPAEEVSANGRRLGVALVVFLILIVATLTLSLFLHHAAPGGSLS